MPPRRSRKPARRSSPKRAAAKRSKPARASKDAALTCPDCGFVAAHPMGLGRHRSTRHGAVSKRAQRQRSAGRAPAATPGWISRQEAAQRAGVHYNTVRQWEQAGLLKTTRKTGVRGSLISIEDLQRVLGERATVAGAAVSVGGGGADAAALAALERKVDALLSGLEQMLASLRSAGATRRRPGRPLGSKNKPKSAPAKSPAKSSAKRAKRGKRARAKRR